MKIIRSYQKKIIRLYFMNRYHLFSLWTDLKKTFLFKTLHFFLRTTIQDHLISSSPRPSPLLSSHKKNHCQTSVINGELDLIIKSPGLQFLSSHRKDQCHTSVIKEELDLIAKAPWLLCSLVWSKLRVFSFGEDGGSCRNNCDSDWTCNAGWVFIFVDIWGCPCLGSRFELGWWCCWRFGLSCAAVEE